MLQVSNYQTEAAQLLKNMGVKFTANFIKHDYYFTDDKEQRDVYRITFSRSGQRFLIRFGQSIANTGTAPTQYDVLSCIQKYDVGSFENFCSEFGYDQDSRKAEKVYKAVCRDERNNGDGWWIYLNEPFFNHELECRIIHEQKLNDCISQLKTIVNNNLVNPVNNTTK